VVGWLVGFESYPQPNPTQPNPTQTLSDVNVKGLIMAQENLRITLVLFVIGLLLIELGLFCYSFYDPTFLFLQDRFPFRGWAYFLLAFGVVALFFGTLALLSLNGEEKE